MINNENDLNRKFKIAHLSTTIVIILIFTMTLIFMTLGLLGIIILNEPLFMYIAIVVSVIENVIGIILLYRISLLVTSIRKYVWNDRLTTSNMMLEYVNFEKVDMKVLTHFNYSVYGNIPDFSDILKGVVSGVNIYSYSVSYKKAQKSSKHEARVYELSNVSLIPNLTLNDIDTKYIENCSKISFEVIDSKLYLILDNISVKNHHVNSLNPIFFKTIDEYIKRVDREIEFINYLINLIS